MPELTEVEAFARAMTLSESVEGAAGTAYRIPILRTT